MNNDKFEGMSAELVAALERCNVLADEKMLEYFYQLYDPKTGGFYYSISSRDCEEMTPFSEGTAFCQEALLYGGMKFPEWYKEKVSRWIENHQDEGDGFFYEDLWGKITSGPRLNRDLQSSVGILARCGKKPLYPTPDERMKANETETETNTTIPDRLSSREKMLEYLESLDWSTKSIWSTGQKLSTESTLIKAAGLYDFVVEYVKSKQNPETGLFGDDLEWMNTNGSMKLSSFMNYGGAYPRAEQAIDSVLKIYSGDIPPQSATFIWNPFVLLDRIINNPLADTDKLRKLLYEKGADIINRAIDCALLLRREDGGFSGSISRGGSRQQGYLYGMGLVDESDVDGTLIAGPRLRNSIYYVFGVPTPKDYYVKYNDEFWERCRTKPEIVKTKPRPEGVLNHPLSPTPIYKPVW